MKVKRPTLSIKYFLENSRNGTVAALGSAEGVSTSNKMVSLRSEESDHDGEKMKVWDIGDLHRRNRHSPSALDRAEPPCESLLPTWTTVIEVLQRVRDRTWVLVNASRLGFLVRTKYGFLDISKNNLRE